MIVDFSFPLICLKFPLDYGLIFSSVSLISPAVNPVINTLGLPLSILYFKHFLSEAFHFFHLIFILLVVCFSFISAPLTSTLLSSMSLLMCP